MLLLLEKIKAKKNLLFWLRNIFFDFCETGWVYDVTCFGPPEITSILVYFEIQVKKLLKIINSIKILIERIIIFGIIFQYISLQTVISYFEFSFFEIFVQK